MRYCALSHKSLQDSSKKGNSKKMSKHSYRFSFPTQHLRKRGQGVQGPPGISKIMYIYLILPLEPGMQACSENFQSDARAKDLLKCESQDKPEIIFVLQNNRLADGAFLAFFTMVNNAT